MAEVTLFTPQEKLNGGGPQPDMPATALSSTGPNPPWIPPRVHPNSTCPSARSATDAALNTTSIPIRINIAKKRELQNNADPNAKIILCVSGMKSPIVTMRLPRARPHDMSPVRQ